MTEEVKRRLVGVTVLLVVFSLIAWWVGSRDDNSDELPPATAQIRNYDVRDLDRIASAQVAQQPVAEPVLEPGNDIVYEKVETIEAPVAAAVVKKEESPAVVEPATREKSPDVVVSNNKVKTETKPDTQKTVSPKPAEVVEEKPPTNAKGQWIVQVSSVTQQANAQALAERLGKNGWKAFLTQGVVNEKTYYRVRVGPYSERSQAEKAGLGLKKFLGQNVAVMKR